MVCFFVHSHGCAGWFFESNPGKKFSYRRGSFASSPVLLYFISLARSLPRSGDFLLLQRGSEKKGSWPRNYTATRLSFFRSRVSRIWSGTFFLLPRTPIQRPESKVRSFGIYESGPETLWNNYAPLFLFLFDVKKKFRVLPTTQIIADHDRPSAPVL